jgi:hypothetical protein
LWHNAIEQRKELKLKAGSEIVKDPQLGEAAELMKRHNASQATEFAKALKRRRASSMTGVPTAADIDALSESVKALTDKDNVSTGTMIAELREMVMSLRADLVTTNDEMLRLRDQVEKLTELVEKGAH